MTQKPKVYEAVNWNKPDDSYTKSFWDDNFTQFWSEEEIPVSNDLNVWATLSSAEQTTYLHVLGGLTLLDTRQGTSGMPKILEHVEGHQRKAVLSFMGMMENIHAKSYSRIFSTLCVTDMGRIEEVFNWVHTNEHLQKKADLVEKYYGNIRSKKSLYRAMAASVFLESFLFYSGFFYPLYLDGQGKMTNSCEIIKLILKDENIHGTYVGILAQEIFAEFTPNEQKKMEKEIAQLLRTFYDNELLYTEELYRPIGLVDEVNQFLRYNANKAMMNLGLEPIFGDEEINPIVENGLSTKATSHDFFSQKGNSYTRTINFEPLQDEDFIFETKDEFASVMI